MTFTSDGRWTTERPRRECFYGSVKGRVCPYCDDVSHITNGKGAFYCRPCEKWFDVDDEVSRDE